MSIDITQEDLIRLSEVPKLKCMPRTNNGKPVHLATIYRWTMGGTGGVRLETIKVGGSQCTSVEALQRFFDALSQRGNRDQGVPDFMAYKSSARRRRDIADAERRLSEAGI